MALSTYSVKSVGRDGLWRRISAISFGENDPSMNVKAASAAASAGVVFDLRQELFTQWCMFELPIM